MKQTLKEQKNRIRQLISLINEQEYSGDPIDGGLKLSELVFVKIKGYQFSVGGRDDRGLKDEIDILVQGDPNQGTLEIVDVQPNDDYTEEEIAQAVEMVKEHLPNLPDVVPFNINTKSFEMINEQEGETDYSQLEEFKRKLEELTRDYVHTLGLNGVIEGMEDVMSGLQNEDPDLEIDNPSVNFDHMFKGTTPDDLEDLSIR